MARKVSGSTVLMSNDCCADACVAQMTTIVRTPPARENHESIRIEHFRRLACFACNQLSSSCAQARKSPRHRGFFSRQKGTWAVSPGKASACFSLAGIVGRCGMYIIRAGLRPALALFVIAHGLAHAVLPL